MTRFPIYLFAAALLAAAGCDKDKPEIKDPETLYTITIVPSEGGAVKASVDGTIVTKAAEGAKITLTARVETDYKFKSWSGEVDFADIVAGPDVPATPSTFFTMPAADVEVGAKFVFVDAGAVEINGVVWASRNVDAPGTLAATSYDPGMYYQWNRREGWSNTEPMVSTEGRTEWDTTNAEGKVWAPENDPSPAGWKVPTGKEFNRLMDNTKVGWKWANAIGDKPAGHTFTEISTGNTLFFPAVGARYYQTGELRDPDDISFAWSAEGEGTFGYQLHLFWSGVEYPYASWKCSGFSVRPVRVD